MATQPAATSDILIERTSDYRHFPADQLLALFLGTDYDLCFLTSAPRPLMQRVTDGAAEAEMHADARIVESVRVRMNVQAMRNAVTALVSAITEHPGIDLDKVERDISGIIENARRSRAS